MVNFDHFALKDLLEDRTKKYNNEAFIEEDPVSIPHLFSLKEDIEISGFLTAAISWGRRSAIIKSAHLLLQLMDYAPFEFIQNARSNDFKEFQNFKYRTFNGQDCEFFLKSLQNIYLNHGGLEKVFSSGDYRDAISDSIYYAILNFRSHFFSLPHSPRTQKHIADPSKGSAAKRINMFLRWMIRKDDKGVDFGIWNILQTSQLMCPLDVHSGKIARKLALLQRNQNDWKAVEELTSKLRLMDPEDPVKYDFALFGMGMYENF